MIDLIKKEFRLAVHPTMVIFLLFAAFVFIPDYPYEIMFFFSTLGVFFMCLNARENNDTFFTCTLPVKKASAAYARIFTAMIFQLLLVAFAAILSILKSVSMPVPNAASMDANAVFLGTGLMILGVFNVTFFPLQFKRPTSVGVPFVVSSVMIFVMIIIEIVLCHAVPFVRDNLDTYDTQWLWLRLIIAFVGAVIYGILTFIALIKSSKNLEKVDL